MSSHLLSAQTLRRNQYSNISEVRRKPVPRNLFVQTSTENMLERARNSINRALDMSRINKAGLYQASKTANESFGGVLDFSDTIKRLDHSRKKLQKYSMLGGDPQEDLNSTTRAKFDHLIERLNGKIEESKNNSKSLLISDKHERMSRSASALHREHQQPNSFRYKAVELTEAIDRLEKILSKKPFEIIQQNLIETIDQTDDVYFGQMVDLFLMMIVKKKKVIELLNDETSKRARSVPKPIATPRGLGEKPLKLASKNQVTSQRDLPNPNTQGNFFSNRLLNREDADDADIKIRGIEPDSPLPARPGMPPKEQNCRKVLFEDRTGPEDRQSAGDSLCEDSLEKYNPKVTSRGIIKDQKIKSFFKEFETRKKSRYSPLENSRLGNLISAQLVMKEERGYLNQPRENLPAKSPLLQTSRDNLNHRYPKPRGAPLHSRVNSIFELQDAKNPSNPATSLNQTLQLNEPLLRDPKLEMNKRPYFSFAGSQSPWQSLQKPSADRPMTHKENTSVKRDRLFKLPQSDSLVNSINRIQAAHEKFDRQDSAIQHRSRDRIEQFKNRLVAVQKV